MSKTLYRTDFINESGGVVRIPMFIDGSRMIVIPKGTPQEPKTGWIEQDKTCLYAGYTKVVYKFDGTVRVSKRLRFKVDKKFPATLLKNESNLHFQMMGNVRGRLYIPQEIDVWHTFDIMDIESEYQEIKFTVPQDTGETRLTVDNFGAPMIVPVTRDVWKIRRSPKDMQRLKKMRMEAQEAEVQKDLEAEEQRQLRKLRLQEEGQK